MLLKDLTTLPSSLALKACVGTLMSKHFYFGMVLPELLYDHFIDDKPYQQTCPPNPTLLLSNAFDVEHICFKAELTEFVWQND